MAKAVIKKLMTETSKRKDEEHKMKPRDKQMEAAKQAFTTGSDDDEEANGAGRSGEADGADEQICRKCSRSTRGA